MSCFTLLFCPDHQRVCWFHPQHLSWSQLLPTPLRMDFPKPPQSWWGFCSSQGVSHLAPTHNPWTSILLVMSSITFLTHMSHHTIPLLSISQWLLMLLDKTRIPAGASSPACLCDLTHPLPTSLPTTHAHWPSPCSSETPGQFPSQAHYDSHFLPGPSSPQPFARCTPLLRSLSKRSSPQTTRWKSSASFSLGMLFPSPLSSPSQNPSPLSTTNLPLSCSKRWPHAGQGFYLFTTVKSRWEMGTEGSQNTGRVNSVSSAIDGGPGWETGSSVFVITAPICTEHFLWALAEITSFTQELWSPVFSPGTSACWDRRQKDRPLCWHGWGQGGDSCHPLLTSPPASQTPEQERIASLRAQL